MVALLLCLLALLLPGPSAAAGSERYEYDGLGRLVRVIDAGNRVTEYQYDAAGNITAVIAGGAAVAPTVTAVQPTAVRRASTVRMSLTGTQLANASLSAVDPEITISRVTRAATTMAFDLSVSAAAALGASSLRVSTAAGTASTSITVRPALPVAQVAPLPIAVAPGGSAAAYDLTLDHADDEAHSFALSMVRPELATVTPTTLSIPAGQTVARFSVRGLVGGNTELRAVSATLGSLQLPVFITANPEGVSSARAVSVGVELARVGPSPVSPQTLALAPLVGVISGSSVWTDTQPRFVAQGGSQTVTLTGQGLPADISLRVEPPTGLSLSAPTLSADGNLLHFTVSAAADVALGLRSLVAQSGNQRLMPTIAGADDFDVVAPGPVVTSVSPLLVEPGAILPSFEIRGRNLQDTTSIEFRGGGLVPSAAFVVNTEGTAIALGLSVSPTALPGERFVVVHAPGGRSAEVPSSANSFMILDGATETRVYRDIPSAMVGVERARPAVDAVPSGVLHLAPSVGVSVGPILTEIAPTALARGERRTLKLVGEELQAVSSIVISPPDGLGIGPVSHAPDGRSINVDVTVDAEAPLGHRRVFAQAPDGLIGFASGTPPSLLITPVVPVLEVVEPTTGLVGSNFVLRLRGRHFQFAKGVRITPAADLRIGPVSVNADGTLAEVSLSIAAAAAHGLRVVSLITPAGETTAQAGSNNTLLIGAQAKTYADLVAASVGVQLGDGPPPNPVDPLRSLLLAPSIGVQVGDVEEMGITAWSVALPVGVERARVDLPAMNSHDLLSPLTGVLNGPTVISIQPTGALRGQTLTLGVLGNALRADAVLQILPSGQIRPLGNPTLSADGRHLSQRVEVLADAPLQFYMLKLLNGDGQALPDAADTPLIQVLPGLPDVVSLEPILARRSDSFELIVRGSGLQHATQVQAEPANGLQFGSGLSVNAAGTELRVPVRVEADATQGPRVIRVLNRAGASSPLASPANTFTVYPEE